MQSDNRWRSIVIAMQSNFAFIIGRFIYLFAYLSSNDMKKYLINYSVINTSFIIYIQILFEIVEIIKIREKKIHHQVNGEKFHHKFSFYVVRHLLLSKDFHHKDDTRTVIFQKRCLLNSTLLSILFCSYLTI